MHICYGYGIEANLQWKATLGDVWDQYAKRSSPRWPRATSTRSRSSSPGSRVPLDVIRLLDGKKDVLVGAIDVTTSHRRSARGGRRRSSGLAMEFTSPERIFPCTNCGMVPLPRAVSRGKLKALGAGAALVRAEL